MNRHERRALKIEQQGVISQQKLPERLTPVDPAEFPAMKRLPAAAWRSRKYLVQLWPEANASFPGLVRLSICRTTLNDALGWKDGLSWDELQAIKRECGFGDWYGIEVYPPDGDVVNVANFRHLWLMRESLGIGWRS